MQWDTRAPGGTGHYWCIQSGEYEPSICYIRLVYDGSRYALDIPPDVALWGPQVFAPCGWDIILADLGRRKESDNG